MEGETTQGAVCNSEAHPQIKEGEDFSSEPTSDSAFLSSILHEKETLQKRVQSVIAFSPPILTRFGLPVIFPGTINAIQGKTGSHKSRLAEIICSAAIAEMKERDNTLGFSRTSDSPLNVVLIDTERNLKEQLPAAIQNIFLRAGYLKERKLPHFEYFSLLNIGRHDRLSAIREYLNSRISDNADPLLVIIDVASDLIADFNNVEGSLNLVDMLNMMVNEYDITFICVLHENPFTEKMRGHLGTELANKATTVMQTAIQKDSRNEDTDLVKVSFTKSRNTKRLQSIYAIYDPERLTMIEAEQSMINSHKESKHRKADISAITGLLLKLLPAGKELSRIDLLKQLETETDASERTLDDRLRKIVTEKIAIQSNDGTTYVLVKKHHDSQQHYSLRVEPAQG